MSIQNYLKSLKECPDDKVNVGEQELDRLTAEWGVYDNWPILVNAEIQSLIEHLSTCGKYKLVKKQTEDTGEVFILDYIPGIIKLKVRNIHTFDTTGHGYAETPEEIIHSEKQISNYNLTIVLYPYQEKNNPRQYRVMAEVIEDLANYFMQNKMKFCFPKSTGRLREDDLERIVYGEEYR